MLQKTQTDNVVKFFITIIGIVVIGIVLKELGHIFIPLLIACLLYTSDAADERSSVDLGGRRIIKKKTLNIQMI